MFPDPWALAAIAAKTLMYLGIFTSTGLVLAQVVFATPLRPLASWIARRAAIFATLGLIGTIAAYSLRGAQLTGNAMGLIDPVMLGLLWDTAVGEVLRLRCIGLSVLLLGLLIPRFGPVLSSLGGAIALSSFAQVGHVQGLEPVWPQALLVAHLLGIAFWIGILLPLSRLSRMPKLEPAATVGHRFGKIAMATVPALIVAGIVLAWILVPTLRHLWKTEYGLGLLGKTGIVALLLLMAAVNKTELVPGMQRGERAAALGLRRVIRVEWALICTILVVTATMTSLYSPTR